MKDLLKRTAMAIAVICTDIVICHAYTNPVLGHLPTRGVGNVTYTVNGGASSYTSAINSAASNWMYTGYGSNPIYMTAVSSTYGSNIDIYTYCQSGTGKLAYTEFWQTGSVQVSPYASNWFWNNAYINTATTTSSTIGPTMRHEFGHCFGLDENNGNPYSIMAQTAFQNASITTVQQCDHDTINQLYP